MFLIKHEHRKKSHALEKSNVLYHSSRCGYEVNTNIQLSSSLWQVSTSNSHVLSILVTMFKTGTHVDKEMSKSKMCSFI